MDAKEKIVKKYLRQTNRYLIGKRKIKKRFLDSVESDIRQFLEKNEATGQDELIAEFGTPLDTAAEFSEINDKDALKKKVIMREILVFAVSAIFTFIVVFYLTIFIIERNKGYYGIETLEIIEEITEEDMVENTTELLLAEQ